MATVTGFTAEKVLALVGDTVVSGAVVGGNLILTTKDGALINAGSVRGPVGATGGVSESAMNAAIAAALLPLPKGVLAIAERNTDQTWAFQGDTWLDITGASVSVTLTPGRYVEIAMHASFESWEANTEIDLIATRVGGSRLVAASKFARTVNKTVVMGNSRRFLVPEGWSTPTTIKLQVKFDTEYEVRSRGTQNVVSLSVTDLGAPPA